MEMVKKKIQSLQLQVDEAEDRALAVQRELDFEKELREKVRNFTVTVRAPGSRPDLSCSSP